MELQDVTDRQTSSQDNNCRTSGLFISNQRPHTSLSDRNTNQTLASDGATCSVKESTSCWSNVESMVFGTGSNLILSYKTAGAQPERDISGHQMELRKVNVEGKVGTKMKVAKEELEDARMGERKGKKNEEPESSSAFALYAKNNMSNSEPEKTQKRMKKTSNISCHLKTRPTLTVYKRYQLCVDQLHHLRVRQRQYTEPGCFIDSPAKDRKTSEEIAPQNPEIEKRLNKAGSKIVTAAEITKERSSGVINKNQDRSQYNRSRATLTEHGQHKHCDSLTVKETPAASRPVCQRNKITTNTHLSLNSNTCGALIKATAGVITSIDEVINTHMEQLGNSPGNNGTIVEENAALTTNPGLFSERIECNPDVKGCQRSVKGQKTKAGRQGASLRLCEKSSVSLSCPPNKEILQRPPSSGVNKHTKSHTPEDKVKPTSACSHTHKCLPSTETHTHLHDDPRPPLPASGACPCKQTGKYSVSLFVTSGCLCLMRCGCPSCLCCLTVICAECCRSATACTHWPLITHSELKVTSCTGPCLHGDQMLPLIGQLCHHVTSVDVSWSGATDTGVKALSDCCPGLRLKSVVLNGCHVTDDPLMKLVMRHKETLCRLEVFGCQFLTPSCLQTVYEMCPGLQHLNIGQVPKVNTHSLTVMTSQLKCLISLNLTGLHVITDAAVDTLLQNCVEIQSLTFSSCPGVTDLTLHSIRKYTPCIRSLDVSGCKAVTDAGVQSLSLGCRRLQQLDLSSTGTGNRGVTLLANYCSRYLRTVKLSFCHITLENILKLCRCCKRLKVLHLYGCAHLPAEREIREVNATVKVYPLS
ncbi:uncharacterized protein LOC120560723 isoform X4 [Perca fluviatilis]|uniref:uncharacterized protein LOC120560723 isoform X4 n=1 Tax=Perca fluviatilis TaxID=8168 RepID=UPI00196312C1|nr:uncharacterized protein LOC120560723 isoform X4 [Perca fluviatilis]